MSKDYIPASDNDFQAWAQNFDDYVTMHVPDLGLLAPDIVPITVGRVDFDAKMTAHVAAQLAAQAARQAKDDSRATFEGVIRALVGRLQVSSSVDDTERAAMGITVRDTTPTSPTGGISTRPVGVVDTSQRLRHEIRFTDEATPTSRAKPAGIMGCEIWVKVAALNEPPPADPGELSFAGLDTASPYTVEYAGADGGKTAHYMLRWVRSDNEKGPWSETVSATITA